MPPPRPLLRTAAATFQIGAGLIAVFLCGLAVSFRFHQSDVDEARGLLLSIWLLLGPAMFVIWWRARSRRTWLKVLAAVSAFLTIVLVAITWKLYGPARVTEQVGVWTGIASAGIDSLLWFAITLAAIGELRMVPRDDEAERSAEWTRLVGITVPLVLITALAVLVATAGTGWLIRLNNDVVDPAPVDSSPLGPGTAPALSGTPRWDVEVASSGPAVAAEGGLAVPVTADAGHAAGVIMLDPATGRPRWRQQLRGADDAPKVASTDGGRSMVVRFEGGTLSQDLPERDFTLSADTGQVQAIWPTTGSLVDTDPPVLFHHVGQGTNSVTAISPSGRKLWTHRPERCADPRSVSSTPEVMVVRARQCGKGYKDLQILGLDARTGEQRWVVPAVPKQSERGPDSVVVRRGFQWELDGGSLSRRSLDTGVLAWSTPPAVRCERNHLAAEDRTAYVAQCDVVDGEATMLAAHDADTGEQNWSQQLGEPITALAAVDEHRALAVTHGATTCTVRMVQQSGSTALLTLPSPPRPMETGDLRCEDAELISVDGRAVLQIRVVDRSSSSAERHRLIALP